MKEKSSKNIKVPVLLMKILFQTQESFDGFFLLRFYILRWFFGEQDF